MEYITLIVLFLLSAFFSGSETALTSVNKLRLETKAYSGDVKAKKVLSLTKNPERMLTTILIGNNFVNILLTSLTTYVVVKNFGEGGLIYATLILTVLVVIVSEITPKSVAAVFPEKFSYLVVFPIIMVMKVLTPLVFIISKFTNVVIAILSKGIHQDNSVSTDELKAMVNRGSQEGVIKTQESILLHSVIDFKSKDAGDALNTPRVDIVALTAEATYEEVRKIIQEEQYSRYPVYADEADNIIGFFYAKDFVSWTVNPEDKITNYIDRNVLFVPESMGIEKLFKEMQEKRKHIAMVVDEFGGISGLISLEDVIELMIGHEINDEKDDEENSIIPLNEDTIDCMADIKLEKIEALYPITFKKEIDTLGEFVLNMMGKIPKKGDKFSYGAHYFTVKEMQKRRIKRIIIKFGNNDTEAE